MKEHPIIFSGPMVRTILREEYPKTQTRRIIMPQPEYKENSSLPGRYGTFTKDGWNLDHPIGKQSFLEHCPYGQVNDRLWVRETFWHHKECRPPFEHTGSNGCCRYEATEADHAKEPGRWLTEWYVRMPSIFMPRWASRLTLEIVDIRIERLQEITEEAARAEGISDPHEICPRSLFQVPGDSKPRFTTASTAFEDFWDSINAKRGFGWDKNPWVWVIEFKRQGRG